MNPLIRLIDPAILVWVLDALVFAMAAILVTLIVLLVLQKLVLERRSRAVQETADRYAQALAETGAPEQLVFDPRRVIQRQALARALGATARHIPNSRLRGAPWYGELLRRVQRDAERGRWGHRVAAFEMIGSLGATELRPFLEQAAHHERHPEAYAACVGCLARFTDQPSFLVQLWRQLQQRPPLSGSFNEGLFRTAIAALTRHGSAEVTAEVFHQLLHDVDPRDPLTLNAISAIGKSGLTRLVPHLAALYARPGFPKEMRIACVRAVGMLQPDHPLLLNALADPDWEVCAVGARYLRGSTSEAIEGLSGCLTSPAFYVRYNAACTLAELGEQGRRVLERALQSSDAFARDISRYALHTPWHQHA